jgi:mannose-6-phosphate isomerase-like protein (cupin superfamily)
MEKTSVHDALSTYVVLGAGGRAQTVEGGADFWSALTRGERPEVEVGTLIAAFDAEGPLGAWEMHPQGEELVLLVAGRARFHLDHGREREAVELRAPGAFVLVPRGTWHRIEALEPSKLLFVTYGAGTQHRGAEGGSDDR